MQHKNAWLTLAALLSFVAFPALSGCKSHQHEAAEESEEGDESAATRVSVDLVSAPARATIERLTAGGRIEKITREQEHGVLLYDVEANVDGKHVEWAIADADGSVIGTETEIAFAELPAAVREQAEKYFDSLDGLLAMQGVEGGKTEFEVVGMHKGKKAEAVYDPQGKRLE